MIERIDQLLAGFAQGDAISSEARQLQAVFREWGLKSDIVVDPAHTSQDVQGTYVPLRDWSASSGTLALNHFSIDSPVSGVFSSLRTPRIMLYHNITPASFFAGFDDALAAKTQKARSDLKGVAVNADAVWADSAYNAAELSGLGISGVDVFQLPFDPSAWANLGDVHELTGRFDCQLITWLFVGRVVPNKRIEQLIEAFAWYHRVINRQSRLVIVGSDRSCPRYFLMLQMLAGELGLPNVCFQRFASPAGLSECYRQSDVFVTASEHEGYCLPLVEALYHGLPVIARASGGMPEALDGAGVMYRDLAPVELSELVHRVLSDDQLQRQLENSRLTRIDAVTHRDLSSELRRLLSRWIA